MGEHRSPFSYIMIRMNKRYINSFCYCSTIKEFLELSRQEWLSAMIENYHEVTPHELLESQITAWKDEYAVLSRQLKKIINRDSGYEGLTIIFEYVLWDFDNDNGVRPDVIILSRNRVGIIEFKTREINEEDHKYITKQAKKYRHRLLHNHVESKDMKLGTVAIMTSMKDYYEILGRVRCISPDRFIDVYASLMGLHPLPHPDPYGWINSDYVLPQRKEEE